MWIFSGKDTVLTWELRVQILRDCALALRYLHQYVDGCIVHRDIKVSHLNLIYIIISLHVSNLTKKFKVKNYVYE